MIRKLAVTATVFGVVLTPTAAFAEGQVGIPGTPTCYGLRVSTGNHITFEEEGQSFRLTPVTRAGFNGISVQQFHQRVWNSCQ
jgi:hypothetical protein